MCRYKRALRHTVIPYDCGIPTDLALLALLNIHPDIRMSAEDVADTFASSKRAYTLRERAALHSLGLTSGLNTDSDENKSCTHKLRVLNFVLNKMCKA